MSGTEITIVIALCSAVVGGLSFLIAYLTYTKNKKKDDEKTYERNGELLSDIKYIKKGIDELKGETKETKNELVELGQRVSKVEESSKQAHKRIDELTLKVG